MTVNRDVKLTPSMTSRIQAQQQEAQSKLDRLTRIQSLTTRCHRAVHFTMSEVTLSALPLLGANLFTHPYSSFFICLT